MFPNPTMNRSTVSKWTLFRGILTLACFCLFLGNSYQNTMQYLSGQATVSQIVNHSSHGWLPSLTFCNKTGFKKDGLFPSLKWFLENTVNPEDIFADPVPSLIETYGRYTGRCYTYNHPIKVASEYPVLLTLNKNATIKVYAHDPGAELGVYLDYWPGDAEIIEVRDDTAIIDIKVIQTVTELEQDCNPDPNYKFIDCVRKIFARHQRAAVAINSLPNCTAAWIESLAERNYYDDTNPCSLENESQHYVFLRDIWSTAYKGDKGCQQQCRQAFYKVNWSQSGFNSHLDDPDHVVIYFYFTDTNVMVMKEVKLMTFNEFISAIGGSLGLFLGFSCLSAMLDATSYLRNKFPGVQQNKRLA